MGDIKFDFSLDKLIHSIAFFSGRGIADLTKLKVAKLLYFADKKHLLEYGRPILGDVYWCMNLGPVPSFALNEMSEAINRSEVSKDEDSDYNQMSKVLKVKRSFFSPYPWFEARLKFDASVFSEAEIYTLDSVATQYGERTARQLVDLTHEDPTWKVANVGRNPGERSPIDYELFFEGAPESARKHLARLKADFSGEVIPLASDKEYSDFAAKLLTHEFDSDFDLDADHAAKRAITH